MCSLSWRVFDGALCVAFNRDESPLREKALPPQRFNDRGVNFVMPLDPQGQGSWLAVNEYGLVICLLNDYQSAQKVDEGQLVSRGQIVRHVASMNSITQISSWWSSLSVSGFQPFDLAVLSKDGIATRFHNNGRVKSQHHLPSSYFSSGHPQATTIYERRQQHVNNFYVSSLDHLIKLHQSHDELHDQDGGYSICMHKEIAHTQSLTVIEISDDINWKYWDGQPCQTDQIYTGELALQK